MSRIWAIEITPKKRKQYFYSPTGIPKLFPNHFEAEDYIAIHFLKLPKVLRVVKVKLEKVISERTLNEQ